MSSANPLYWTASSAKSRAPMRKSAAFALVLLGTVAVAASSAFVASDRWDLGACVAFVALACAGFGASLSAGALSSGLLKKYLLISWFVATPIASYFIRFPADKSIVTFDRLMICGLGLWLVLEEFGLLGAMPGSSARTSAAPAPQGPDGQGGVHTTARSASRYRISATKFEIAFGLLAVLALVSVVTQSSHVATALRTAFDAMILPLIVFRLARHWLSVKTHAGILVFLAILLSLFLLITGSYELLTGVNLFPLKGSDLLRDGEFRVNGPFVADSSYALIALLLAVFLLAAPRLLGINRRTKVGVALTVAALPAIIATLLPLFRSVVLALGVCWILIEALGSKVEAAARHRGDSKESNSEQLAGLQPINRDQSRRRPISGAKPAAIVAGVLVLFIAVAFAAGGGQTMARLTSARNVFGRLVTWQTAVNIWATHPALGVGLGNYGDSFSQGHAQGRSSLETALSTHVASSPHSNVLWIASELGAVGVVLYLVAHFYLFAMGLGTMRRAMTLRARATAVCFLAVLIAYWIPGLELETGAYWDVNLYYFFILGFLSSKNAD